MAVELLQLDALGLDRLAPVGLDEVLARAELLDRVDRKYVVPISVAEALVGDLAEHHRVLSIAGRRTTSYRTTYYDTDDLRCVRDHIQGRRRRFKARSRLYVEDRLCQLEVKTKGRRGATLKAQRVMAASDYGTLSPGQHQFIDAALAGAGVPRPDRLTPSLEICCTRGTVVDLTHAVRITFDTNLVCRYGTSRVTLDDHHVVIETKGGLRASTADLLLQRAGHRPRSFSKYAAAGSLLVSGIPYIQIRPMLGVELHHHRHDHEDIAQEGTEL
jgi:hypothetical protein